ncbi:CHAT domain-containing protein [Streptomyces violascens]|uniref:CHAT domain-containing protein n=1 Tax=Streptomyces violascens TaxID=67381 RepID=UPI00369FF208
MKILFVAANPLDTGRLALDEEIRAIERKTAGSPFASQMEFIAIWAARPDDLLQAVNDHAPAVIHFAGHASASWLSFVGNNRRAQRVTKEAILRLIDLQAAASVRAVVLNACYSSELAAAIERKVGCAVGMTGRWCDEQASLFSSSFYRAIGFGGTIEEAVEQGCASILLEGLTGADNVRLHCDGERARSRLLGAPQFDAPEESEPASRPRNEIPLFNESECAEYVDKLLKRSGGRAALTFIDVDGVLVVLGQVGAGVGVSR